MEIAAGGPRVEVKRPSVTSARHIRTGVTARGFDLGKRHANPSCGNSPLSYPGLKDLYAADELENEARDGSSFGELLAEKPNRASTMHEKR